MEKTNFPDFLNTSQKKQLEKAIELGKPVIIKGPQGPTGKTTIVNFLRNQGVEAFEEWECLTLELDLFEEFQVYEFGQYQNYQVSIESKFNGKREKIELPKHGQVLIISLPN